MCPASASLQFHTISSTTIWQGKLELGSVQLEAVGWVCSAPFTLSKGGQPSRETSALIQVGFASNGRRGACSVVLLPRSNLHLVKGEDMGMGLPKNYNGNDSLYFLSLISSSALESRAGSGLRVHRCT